MFLLNISGSFTLSIIDQNLNFSELEQNIGIIPTKIIRKGQLIGKLKNIEAPYDIWSYEIKITNEKDIFADLIGLLNKFLPYSSYIKKIGTVYDQVKINCYLRSDFAQIGFGITGETISILKKFGLGINFHILSFGGVED